MSAITIEQARAQLAALLAAQGSNLRTVTIAGRSVTYATGQEMIDAANYWARIVTDLERKAAGRSRHGYAAASFRNPQ